MEWSTERAVACLEGLSAGDAFGQLHFRPEYWIRNTLPAAPWLWTDDTEMACCLVNVLIKHGCVEQSALAAEFAKRFDQDRGYGPAMVFDLLPRIAAGEHWSIAAASLFDGTGSFGNGSAMRVAPIGAFFADDRDRVVAEAAKSSVVTHTHPDAVAGAIAVAVGAAVFASEDEFSGPRRFFELVMPHIPESAVRKVMETALEQLGPRTDVQEVARVLGNGSQIAAFDTVPFCLWIAGRFGDSFEKAVHHAVLVGGDMDTTAAIVGGMLACRHGVAGIPDDWLSSREPLPRWLSQADRS